MYINTVNFVFHHTELDEAKQRCDALQRDVQTLTEENTALQAQIQASVRAC